MWEVGAAERGGGDPATNKAHPSTEMWPRLPLVSGIASAAIVLAVLYLTYRWVDPLPPRHLAIAAGPAGSVYDNFARQYARILARHGVELEIRNSAGALEDFALLRDARSGVQAALTTLGFCASVPLAPHVDSERFRTCPRTYRPSCGMLR